MAANPEAIRRRGNVQAGSRPKPEMTLWRRIRKKHGSTIGFAAASAAIYIGITGRESRRLFADEGLGYVLGIIGSLLILVLLLYPLRKRFKFLKFLGNVRNWFQVHMTLGVVGPLAILYHSNFSFGSVNSTAAMLSMLLVAGSGLIGRFLYAKIHHGLFGRKANLKEILGQVKLSTAGTGGAAALVPDLMNLLAEYDRRVLQPPKGILDSALLPFRMVFRTRVGYRRIMASVRAQLDEQAANSPAVRQHRKRLLKIMRAFVREHLRRVRRVAEFAAYDRLFALWHKVHLPFFYLLILTAIIHVIAVHTYSV